MSNTHKCLLGSKCCQGEGETFWLEDFSKLFCNLSPIPYGNLSSGERLNAISRLIIYIAGIMCLCKYKSAILFLAVGLLFVTIVYLVNKNENLEQEKFQFLSPELLNNNMNFPLNILNTQEFNNVPNAEKMRFEAQKIQAPLNSMNINNNYRGSSEQFLKAARLDFESGERDSQAGIQYFKTKSGVNRKTMIEPIIAPRITDKDVWGQSRIVRDGINNQYMVDLTTSDPDYGQTISGMADDGLGMGSPFYYKQRVEGAVVPENNINDNYNIGRYGSGQILYGNENEKDFNKNVLPIYKNFYKKINNNIINTNTDTMDSYDYFGQLKPTEQTPSEAVVIKKEQPAQASSKPSKEKFRFVNLEDNNATSHYGDFTPFNATEAVNQNYGNMGKPQKLDTGYNVMERGLKKNSTPISNIVQEQLLPDSPTYVYNEEYFNQPSSRLYLQDIQPKLYSYAVDQTPLNSNIGIAYNPQRPPRFMDQIVDANKKNYPLMTRIDPQLIRDDGTPGQIAMNPVRTDWSAKYSDYEAPAGSINFEDIYNPTFTSYGDPYRSYSDINLGQVRYYYSDVDAYKMPNFIQRSNVDFIEFTNPQGQVWPYYNREVDLDAIKAKVENQTTADEIYHREDMMENLMAKMNRSNYQQRYAPLRRSANGNSSYGPS
jgi:hypothetical protein